MSLQDLPYELLNYTLKKVKLNPLLALRQTSIDCRNVTTVALANKKLQFTCPPGISKASKSLDYCSQRTNWLDVAFVTTATKLKIYSYSDFLMVENSLQGVTHLTLENCNQLTNVSALGNLHTLDLAECNRIIDVSALGKLNTLRLSSCRRVVDVSALGNLHTLDLLSTGVVDVSALGNVHTLDLSCCKWITDVSALGNVHTLSLVGCTDLTNVSALGNVHTLSLSYCS